MPITNPNDFKFKIPVNEPLKPGVYKGTVVNYEFGYGNKNGTPYVKLRIQLDNGFNYTTTLSLITQLEWKIVNLYKSADIYNECLQDGMLITNWELLPGKEVAFIIDDRGLKDFILISDYYSLKQ